MFTQAAEIVGGILRGSDHNHQSDIASISSLNLLAQELLTSTVPDRNPALASHLSMCWRFCAPLDLNTISGCKFGGQEREVMGSQGNDGNKE